MFFGEVKFSGILPTKSGDWFHWIQNCIFFSVGLCLVLAIYHEIATENCQKE